MPICERCEKEFDYDEEENNFKCEEPLLSFRTMKKTLCSECAIEAVENEENGIFVEECEECGCKFDPIEVAGEFNSRHGDYMDYYSLDRNLCLDCAEDEFTES